MLTHVGLNLLLARALLCNLQPIPKRENLLPQPAQLKQRLAVRDAILKLRPIPARRFGDTQQLAAFLDCLVADIEGRSDLCHGLSPDREQKFIGRDLELAPPGNAAGIGTSGTPVDVGRTGFNGTAAHGTTNCHGHNFTSGKPKDSRCYTGVLFLDNAQGARSRGARTAPLGAKRGWRPAKGLERA